MIEIKNRYNNNVIYRVDEATLSMADLSWADLSRANLLMADLSGANLLAANLSGANLSEANLLGANLSRARFSNTCLDPDNNPNADIKDFQKCGRFVMGYRTRNTSHVGCYRDGRTYTADWFSTSDTECHPGLYLWPTLKLAKDWSSKETIQVYALPEDIHHAGDKWRCRMFKVIKSVN